VSQLEDTVAAVGHTAFDPAELAAIDKIAGDDPDVDLWRAQSQLGA
jgi:hypothetical protein